MIVHVMPGLLCDDLTTSIVVYAYYDQTTGSFVLNQERKRLQTVYENPQNITRISKAGCEGFAIETEVRNSQSQHYQEVRLHCVRVETQRMFDNRIQAGDWLPGR